MQSDLINNRFELLNKDRLVLMFEFSRDSMGRLDVSETWRSDTEPLPIGYEGIKSWLTGRQAPKHRKHIEKLLAMCGCEELDGFARVSHALTLNDTFWVREEGSRHTWDSVSLYRNPFDSTIARIAFEGGLYGMRFSSTSPELGTDGSYAKCWQRRDSGIMLLKSGSELFDGREPYSEMYASQIAGVLCKKSVPYKVEVYRGKMVSSCPLFTDEKTGYIPVWKLLNSSDPEKMLHLMETYGADDDFRRMLVLDALIVNDDRHAGNYGMLFDTGTMEIRGMAPVFDHNRALFPGVPDAGLLQGNVLEGREPKIGEDFNLTANDVLTPDIKADLKNLHGFRFLRDGKYNLPERRLCAIESLVAKQIDNILGCIRIASPAHDYSRAENVRDCVVNGSAEIGPQAMVEESDILGNAKVLGHAKIKNSTVEGNAQVGAYAVVRDSRVGGNARVGGTVLVVDGAVVAGEACLDADQVIGEGALVEWMEDAYACGRAEGELKPEGASCIPERLTFYKDRTGGISMSCLADGEVLSMNMTDFLSHGNSALPWDAVYACCQAACRQILGEELVIDGGEKYFRVTKCLKNL